MSYVRGEPKSKSADLAKKSNPTQAAPSFNSTAKKEDNIFDDVDNDYVPTLPSTTTNSMASLSSRTGTVQSYFSQSKDTLEEDRDQFQIALPKFRTTRQENEDNEDDQHMSDESESKMQSEQEKQLQEQQKKKEEIKKKRAVWEKNDAYAESFPAAYEFSFSEATQEIVDDGKERRFAGFESAVNGKKNSNRTKDGYLIKPERKKPKVKQDSYYDGQLQKIEKVIQSKKGGTETKTSKQEIDEDLEALIPQTPKKKAKLM